MHGHDADFIIQLLENLPLRMQSTTPEPQTGSDQQLLLAPQAPSFRTLTPAEREVILLLGTELRPAEGEVLIEENEKVGQTRQAI